MSLNRRWPTFTFPARLKFWVKKEPVPIHIQHGKTGEAAARKFLKDKGLVFLTANFACRSGEIDLIFREGECLLFVEVKARSIGSWTRPARAVDARKKLALARTATEYLRLLKNPNVRYRFDVVEVWLEESKPAEIRHIEGSFNTSTLRRGPRRR